MGLSFSSAVTNTLSKIWGIFPPSVYSVMVSKTLIVVHLGIWDIPVRLFFITHLVLTDI